MDLPTALFVTRELLPFTFGGFAKVAAEYLERADRLRYVALTSWHPQRSDRGKVRFCQVRPIRVLERFRILRGAWFIVLGWWKGLRVRSGVVVGIGFNGACVAVPIGLLRRVPRLSIIYDVDFVRGEFRAVRPLDRAFRKMLLRFLLRNSDLIMCGSDKSKADMLSLFGIAESKVCVNPPGVEKPSPGAPAPRPDADLVLVSVGSLKRNEGFEFVLRAVARVREQIPSTQLLVIGKEVDRAYARGLRDLVAELGLRACVQFLGRVDSVWPYLKMCDVFIVGSYNQKGFSMPVCEASASGRPVVGPEYLAQVGVMVPGETGLVAPNRDAAGLSEAVLRLARDPALRARLGDNGRRYVRTFDWDASAREFERRLLELLRWRSACGSGRIPSSC